MCPNTPDTASAAADTNRGADIPVRVVAGRNARAPIAAAARCSSFNLKLKLAALGAVLLQPFLAAAPYIEHLYPAGAQRGRTLEIELVGRSIDGAREVWVSGEGVTGEVLKVTDPTPAQINEAKKNDAIASQNARLRITIAPDAADGVRDLRIMADSGLSNRFRFEVGLLPEVIEAKPDNSAHPQVLPELPVVVNGQILSADRDRFRFHAAAGQQLLIQVKGRAIKPFLADGVPGWFQPKIALFDGRTGNLIEEADDFRFDPDPVLMWKVPADGDYEVEIWDAVSRGRGDLVYRMTIGELPFVSDIFPLGARAGDQNVEIIARGINLPGAQAKRRASFAGKEPGIVTINAPTKLGRTNSRQFELGSLPETREREPNDTQAKAQPVALPITINGRIGQPGDTDWFSFEAKKGDTLVFDVMARRLDSPLDAKLSLSPQRAFNAAARAADQKPPKLSSDDETDGRYGLITHHADPRLAVTIPADGAYQVMVQDAQGKGGPEYAYRLSIAPAQPDFELRVMPDNLSVPAGGNVVVQLKAFRIDGFDGEVNLHVEGLPPGFALSGATIPEGRDNAILTLAAPRDASPGVYKPRFWADAAIGGKTVRHDVSAAEELMQAFFYFHSVPVAQSYLVVTPPPPFFVEVPRPPSAGTLELVFDQEIEIPVRVVRRAPDAGEAQPKRRAIRDVPVRVTATRLGSPKSVVVTAAQFIQDETDGVVKIRVTDPKRIGAEGVLVIEGTQRAKGRKVSIAAPAIPYKVLPAPGQEVPPPAPEKKTKREKKGKG
ncbi:PPC domain-containing protein [Termitidicoccus mucosus]